MLVTLRNALVFVFCRLRYIRLCLFSVNKVRRKRMSEQSLFKLPPTQTEVALIHQVFIDTVDHGTFRQRRPDDALFMSETKLKNLIICHPEVSPMR